MYKHMFLSKKIAVSGWRLGNFATGGLQKWPPRVRWGRRGVHPDPKKHQESDSGPKKAPEALKSQKMVFYFFQLSFFRFIFFNLEHYE